VIERRQPENGAGRRRTDGFCPLHTTHHDDIGILKKDLKDLEKGKVSMKLFGIFVASVTAISIFVGGVMIYGQREMAKSISEIKTTSTRTETKIDYHMIDKGLEFAPGRSHR